MKQREKMEKEQSIIKLRENIKMPNKWAIRVPRGAKKENLWMK